MCGLFKMAITVFYKPRFSSESLPFINWQRRVTDLHEIHQYNGTEFCFNFFRSKNKLNKHAAEQSEKLSDLKELQSMQFYKNYYIARN